MAAPTGTPRVELTQTSLFFPLPLSGPVENIVKVISKEDWRVGFKIRANSRGRYSVRPSVGFLHPREELMVKFVLDPSDANDHPTVESKDWFMLEVRFVLPTDDTSSTTAFWRQSGVSGQSGKIQLPCRFSEEMPSNMVVKRPELKSPQGKTEVRPEQAAAAPVASKSTTDFVPLTRRPAKPANLPNPAFVAAPFTKESGSAGLAQIVRFRIPLPFVVLLLIGTVLCALYEEDTWLSVFIAQYVR